MAAAGETVVYHDQSYDRMKEVKEFDESKIGVKGLSDTGISTIPRMFIHPLEILNGLKSSSNCDEIPVVDLSDVNSDVHRQKLVVQISEAAKTWGFFQVINHGIPVSVLDEAIAATKAFHEQPREEKIKYYKDRDEIRTKVVYSTNVDLFRANAACWQDYLQISMSPEPVTPEDIPEICRKQVVEWEMHAKKLADTLLELLSSGLGLEAGKLKELTLSEKRWYLGTIYPPCPQPELTMGNRAHTDSIALTVLISNQVPGLQVKHGQEWVDVKPLSGGLIINIGDMLQIISNGEYKSVEHRVLANASEEPRISVILFLNLTKWREGDICGPLPELLTPQTPAIYRDFTMQEYNENFNNKELDSKSMIERIKL